jgi:hypothetical protein
MIGYAAQPMQAFHGMPRLASPFSSHSRPPTSSTWGSRSTNTNSRGRSRVPIGFLDKIPIGYSRGGVKSKQGTERCILVYWYIPHAMIQLQHIICNEIHVKCENQKKRLNPSSSSSPSPSHHHHPHHHLSSYSYPSPPSTHHAPPHSPHPSSHPTQHHTPVPPA